MKKIIFILLSTFLSLTIISCGGSDDSGSSTDTTQNTTEVAIQNTCPAKNWWQLMEGSNSRNFSLVGNPTLRKNNPKNLKTKVKSKRIIDEKLHLKDKVFVECNLVLV